jgi:hypothetical protein
LNSTAHLWLHFSLRAYALDAVIAKYVAHRPGVPQISQRTRRSGRTGTNSAMSATWPAESVPPGSWPFTFAGLLVRSLTYAENMFLSFEPDHELTIRS